MPMNQLYTGYTTLPIGKPRRRPNPLLQPAGFLRPGLVNFMGRNHQPMKYILVPDGSIVTSSTAYYNALQKKETAPVGVVSFFPKSRRNFPMIYSTNQAS